MRKLLCILLSTTLLCLLTYANERKFSFNHLNIEDGLSSIAVNDIWPDPSGVIWIATSVGLDCYDGNSIVSFCPPKRFIKGFLKSLQSRLPAAKKDIFMYSTPDTSVYWTQEQVNSDHSSPEDATASHTTMDYGLATRMT